MKTFKDFFGIKEATDWKYYIMFYEDNDAGIVVHHFVGYENEPTDADVKNNQQEMVDDPDFGVGEKALSWKMKLINSDEFKKVMAMVEK
jgi:hypothetical protein